MLGAAKEGTNTEGKNCCPPVGILKHTNFIYIYTMLLLDVLLTDRQHTPWEFMCSLVNKRMNEFCRDARGFCVNV